MRKFGFVAMAGLIAAALGGWLSTATTARVAPPVNGGGSCLLSTSSIIRLFIRATTKSPADHL